MKKRIRKIIFWAFLGAFFISAPLVILYTAGYRWNFSRFSLEKTGLLSITTEPKNAKIFLDEKDLKKTTPTIIENLVPGYHQLRLEKDGYLSWEKTLEIKAQETTFIPKAVLFLATETQIEEKGNFSSATFNPDGKTAALVTEEEGWLEIWLKNFDNQDKKLLLRLPKNEIDDLKFSWSARGQYLLVEETKGTKKKWEAVSSDGLNRFVFEDLLKNNGWSNKETITSLLHDPFEDNVFYIKGSETVWMVNLLKNNATKLLDEPAVVWQRGELLLFLRQTNNGMELTRQEKDSSQQVVAKIASGNYEFLPAPPTLVLLKEKASNKIILVDDRGIDKPIYLETTAFTTSWNPNNEQQLLYASDFELHVYDTAQQTDELITRLSTPITAALWHPSGSDLLFSDTQNVSAIELDKRGAGRNVFLLANLNSLVSFTITQGGENLFLWGDNKIQSGIFKRKITE